MRLLTWSINNRARPKRIPPELTQAIHRLKPDVAVLTEYVHGPSEDRFLCDLKNIGLSHTCVSSNSPGQNQVLIAAGHRLEEGDIRAPAIHESAPSNALHVCLPGVDLEILGLRVPDFSREPPLRRRFWDWILKTACAVQERPFVILGDFNTDPSYPPARCGDRFDILAAMGWRHAPSGPTFWTPRGHAVRIDHAFVSKDLTIGGSLAVRSDGPFVFAGKGGGALSDHAALWVDITGCPALPKL